MNAAFVQDFFQALQAASYVTNPALRDKLFAEIVAVSQGYRASVQAKLDRSALVGAVEEEMRANQETGPGSEPYIRRV